MMNDTLEVQRTSTLKAREWDWKKTILSLPNFGALKGNVWKGAIRVNLREGTNPNFMHSYFRGN